MDAGHESERRRFERRHANEHLHERAMRCEECGMVWFSAVAQIASAWARCVRCGGRVHTERRDSERRAGQARRVEAA